MSTRVACCDFAVDSADEFRKTLGRMVIHSSRRGIRIGNRLCLFLLLACAGFAQAHIGTENSTEVRVYADHLRVVLRTSIPFAWSLIGDAAPAMADEAGQAVAKPLLVGVAPGLIRLSAKGTDVPAMHVDCLFEVNNDVAFIYTFPRPQEWPVEIAAGFFNSRSSLESGTITVFDYSASRFARDVEPLVRKNIDRTAPSLSFSIPATAPPAPAVTPPPAPTPPAAVAPAKPTALSKPAAAFNFWLLLPAAAAALLLALRQLHWKRSAKSSGIS